MTEMRFLPILRDFLRSRREIYTVRKYKMDRRRVDIADVGVCERIPLGEITDRKQLLNYVPLSGFETLQAWWDKIQQFIPYSDDKMYLYYVVVK